MIRYTGQRLPAQPRIAVFANDAIGNFVMATPLLRLLREELRPALIEYFGGFRTQELQNASPLFEKSHLLLGSSSEQLRHLLNSAGPFDLLINLENTALSKVAAGIMASEDSFAGETSYVCGPCMGVGGRGDLPFADDDRGRLWADKAWIAPDLASRYPFLQSGFISEIFCRLCYLEGPLPPYEVPSADPEIAIPDVLIATAASLPEKLWDYGKWSRVVAALRGDGLTVGLLGAPPKDQAAHWQGAASEQSLVGESLAQDLRGKLTLPQVVGALQRAKATLTIDNGILHLAAAAGTSTVGLFRHGIHRLWAPPVDSLTVLTPGEGALVGQIEEDVVLEAVRRRLNGAG